MSESGNQKKKKSNSGRTNRKVHYWGALISSIPVLVIIVTGLILMLKKDIAWIQPPTVKGKAKIPMLPFEDILTAVKSVPEAGIQSWDDVDRLDVRAGKGVTKVRGKNKWEVQVDHGSGEILQVAFRRSDLIESIHDGSFFHDNVKLFIFLPSAVILLVLWLTGIYLFIQPYLAKAKRKKKERARVAAGSRTAASASV